MLHLKHPRVELMLLFGKGKLSCAQIVEFLVSRTRK